MLLQEMNWPEVDRLDRDTPVIIPIAAMEQHGNHLPLFTDSLLLAGVLDRGLSGQQANVVRTPLMWLGNSHHHRSMPGTMSADPRLYLDLLTGLAENFIQHGFRRIVFLNGHGGNDVPGRQAVFEIRQTYSERSDLLLLLGTYWLLNESPLSSVGDFVQQQMGHAGEWETSMMLKLHPELVGQYLDAPVVAFGNPFLPAARGWAMRDRSQPGHVGQPARATVAKGEQLLEHFAVGVSDLIRRVIQWDGTTWNG